MADNINTMTLPMCRIGPEYSGGVVTEHDAEQHQVDLDLEDRLRVGFCERCRNACTRLVIVASDALCGRCLDEETSTPEETYATQGQ